MPNRILRDGILTSRAVNALGESAEVLYRRLISVVDDYGRFELDLDILRARLFPLQLEAWPTERVGKVLLECRELLALYEVSGRIYLEVNNFKQQTRTKSKCPDINCGHLLANDINCDHLRTKSYSYSYAKSKAETGAETGKKAGGLVTMPTAAERLIGESAERMYSLHPKKRELALLPDALTRAVAMEADPEAKLKEIEAVHATWCETEGWTKSNGDFAPKLAEWISDKGFTRWPKGREPTKKLTFKIPQWRPYDPETLDHLESKPAND